LEHSADDIVRLVLQLAVILIAAKLSGEICERFLKIPPVLGELGAGILIGPFALGGVDIPGLGPLFEDLHSAASGTEGFTLPISESLWSIAQIGAIILLFTAGLETNLRQFVRYAGPASIVAVGGSVVPFILGVAVTVAFGYADGFGDPKALFVGAIFTATSIGISVRVLGDLRRLDTAEGVTILAAAVLDDVLGILILTVVLGIAIEGEFSASSTGLIALKTIGFWVALTGLGVLLSKRISALFGRFRVSGAAMGLALGLAFLASALAEMFGLAMIIGAFSIGLALSGTDLAHRLEEPLRGVYAALIPIFFVVMGMLVDVTALGGVWQFGIAATALAIIGKVVGSGVPALFTGFNLFGAWRIGIGMLPRGEVALIMAGIGVGAGLIRQELFGVAIIVTVVTTMLAPLVLARSFPEGVSGLRLREGTEASGEGGRDG
jgi:Kef-type K+ transport system membrane component KefB